MTTGTIPIPMLITPWGRPPCADRHHNRTHPTLKSEGIRAYFRAHPSLSRLRPARLGKISVADVCLGLWRNIRVFHRFARVFHDFSLKLRAWQVALWVPVPVPFAS